MKLEANVWTSYIPGHAFAIKVDSGGDGGANKNKETIPWNAQANLFWHVL